MKIALHSPEAETVAELESIVSALGHDCVSVTEIAQAVKLDVAVIFAEWALTSRTDDLFNALAACSQRTPPTPLVLLLASRSPGFADRARTAGATDVLFLPPDPDEIAAEIEEVALRPAIAENQSEAFLELRQSSLVGEHPRFLRCLEELLLAARTDETVLLLGETGVGKEMFAKAIHVLSSRSAHGYHAVNCANLNEQLLESELFGTELGAYTGAVKRAGKFEGVGKGTFLLDEIGDLAAASQSKLLRVIEEHRFQRLGSNKDYVFQGRLVCATSVDLHAAVEQGKFRRDLLGRIDHHRITLPPLRERAADIPSLAQRFLDKHAKPEEGPIRLSESTKQLLMAFPYEMNVRQLETIVRRAIERAGPRRIVLPRDLPPEVQHYQPKRSVAAPTAAAVPTQVDYERARTEAHRAVDAIYLPLALKECAGNRTVAAKALGIDRGTFADRLKAAVGGKDALGGGEGGDEAS